MYFQDFFIVAIFARFYSSKKVREKLGMNETIRKHLWLTQNYDIEKKNEDKAIQSITF